MSRQEPPSAESLAPHAPATPSLLVVEEQQAQLAALEHHLESSGYGLVSAHPGEEALRQLLMGEFVLVILGAGLKTGTRLELAHLLRRHARTRAVPLLFLNADGQELASLQEEGAGAVDWLPDSVEPELLRTRVSSLVELYQQAERLRRREVELRQEHEAAFRRMLESNVVGMLSTDYEGHILDANEAFLDMVGYNREDLEAGHVRWDVLTAPGHSDTNERMVRELRTRGVTNQFEKEYLRKDGTRVPVVIASTRMEPQSRNLTFVLDSTQRKRAEERLQVLSEVNRTLAEGLEEMSVSLLRVAKRMADFATAGWVDRLDADGRLVRVAWARPGVEPPSGEVLPEPDSASLLFEAVRGGTSCWLPSLDERTWVESGAGSVLPDAGGSPQAHSLIVAPIKSRDQVLGLVGCISLERGRALQAQDVTLFEDLARRVGAALLNSRLLEETQRAEAESRFLAEASRLLSTSLDYELTLRRVAQLAVPTLADYCAVDMLEGTGRIRRLEVAHRDPEKVQLVLELQRRYPPDLEAPVGLGEVLRSGRAACMSDIPDTLLQLLALDATHLRMMRELELRSYIQVPLMARGRVLGALTFVQAESGRRYSQADLRLAEQLAHRAALSVDNALLYREAREAVRARDEFLSVAAHELKTPLTPLELRLQFLSRELRSAESLPMTQRLASHLEVMQRQVERLSGLVHSILDASSIGARQLALRYEPVDLSRLAHELAASFEPQATKARCPLVVEAPSPVEGQWDRARLEQVLTNLLSNALKYGAGKPVHLRVWSRAGQAYLSVRDEGIGISPEHRERIFGCFERAVSERNYGGLGLGLYVCQEVIRALGGEIQVESQPGQGATFTLSLPLRLMRSNEA